MKPQTAIGELALNVEHAIIALEEAQTEITRLRAELNWIATAWSLKDKHCNYGTRLLMLRAQKALENTP